MTRALFVLLLAGCPGGAPAPTAPSPGDPLPPDAAVAVAVVPVDAAVPDAPPADADLGLRVGDELPLSGKIEFDHEKATIRPKSFAILDELVAFLAAHTSLARLEIQGHRAAGDGDHQYARDLSEDRAKAVLAYLVSKGIARDRLVAQGYGDSVPLVSNKTEEGRRTNRRIEVRILEIR